MFCDVGGKTSLFFSHSTDVGKADKLRALQKLIYAFISSEDSVIVKQKAGEF